MAEGVGEPEGPQIRARRVRDCLVDDLGMSVDVGVDPKGNVIIKLDTADVDHFTKWVDEHYPVEWIR